MNQQVPQWSRTLRILVFGVVFLFLAVVLWYAGNILKPLIVAGFIAYLIHPAINYLIKRTRLSRLAAVNLVYFISLGLIIGAPSTLAPIFFDEFKQVASDVLDLFDQLIVWLMRPHIIPGLPIDFGQWADRLTEFRSTFLSSLPDQALELLGKTSLTALWVLVILAAVYYFLTEWPRLRDGFIGSFPEPYHPELNELYLRVRKIWMNYLRGQLLLMAIVGVVFTIAWTIIGVPGALVLGVIAGFLTLIPDIGPFLAAMLAASVAMLEGSNWSWMPASHLIVMVIVVATYLFLIAIKNFWLRPYIMGRSVRMPEALVLISIILATIVWGILGALLVVPVLASSGIILDYLRRRILGMPPFPVKEPFISDSVPVSGKEKVAAIKSRISKKKKG
jgi:predicted PurR-regulated permease PerM